MLPLRHPAGLSVVGVRLWCGRVALTPIITPGPLSRLTSLPVVPRNITISMVKCNWNFEMCLLHHGSQSAAAAAAAAWPLQAARSSSIEGNHAVLPQCVCVCTHPHRNRVEVSLDKTREVGSSARLHNERAFRQQDTHGGFLGCQVDVRRPRHAEEPDSLRHTFG